MVLERTDLNRFKMRNEKRKQYMFEPESEPVPPHPDEMCPSQLNRHQMYIILPAPQFKA